ncbi:MAG: CDGSH iron-sulfur domain-containing protein [Geodermatophilaceae bacterium]|nr:CDGSH iron-sulfur domain-containing protein [Geodermatophilaceae bacterium]MDQ3455755.1 CDGSH iron-sulfur domain-containing protein [Actinomycetota bacterium]
MDSTERDPRVGGRYRLLAPVGRGGVGRVWSARDEVLGREVAVQQLDLPAIPARRERSLREAHAAARIASPHVARVLDVVEEGDQLWIVMERVPGRSLVDLITERGPLPPADIVRIAQHVLLALTAAVEHDVLHRDVTPSNVLLRPDGSAVLAGFGVPTAEGDPRLAASGAVTGSREYVAPERLAGAEANPATDLWSLGCVLYAAAFGPLQHVEAAAGTRDGMDPDDEALIPAPSETVHATVHGSAGQLGGRLWELARAATELRCQRPDVPGLGEAATALQDLAVGTVDETSKASRIAELAALQSELVQQIEAVPDGPYLVTNPGSLFDHLGVPISTRPLMALCRCGESGIKPTCDGTCHRIEFTTAKDPDRVADRRDSYVGQSVTVLDNRGTCQHSGLCTERLASVFHLGEEPFVTPSGGRLDEIVRAVRDCPSGALSYAMDTVEAREQVDSAGQREPAIEVSQDGPYRITGGIALLDGDGGGGEVARNDGASREHYALCRCGHSQNKPFCSGMHWYVKFCDPVPDADRTPSIFEWCGGLPALTRMTRLFYEKYVPADPMLGPIFANMSADHPQRVAKWLAEVFGGPSCYSDEYGGYPRMIAEHVGKCLTEEWRARWVALMIQSSQEAGLPNDAEFRSAFSSLAVSTRLGPGVTA